MNYPDQFHPMHWLDIPVGYGANYQILIDGKVYRASKTKNLRRAIRDARIWPDYANGVETPWGDFPNTAIIIVRARPFS